METKELYKGVPFSVRSFCGVSFDGTVGWTTPPLPPGGESEFRELVKTMQAIRKELTGTTEVPGYGGVHTWDDWEAYWTDVSVGAPEVDTYTVSIPGRYGLLDLSEILTGAPVYKNRVVSVTLAYPGSGAQWHEEHSDMLAQLHGKTAQMVLDSDPAYYYEGRCTIDSTRQNGVYSTFDISMDAYPYKKEVMDTLDDWLWDPFNLESGVVREYGNILVPANATATPGNENYFALAIYGSQMPTEFWMRSSAPLTVAISGGDTIGWTNSVSNEWRKVSLYKPGGSKTWLKDSAYTFAVQNPNSEDATLTIYFRGGKL